MSTRRRFLRHTSASAALFATSGMAGAGTAAGGTITSVAGLRVGHCTLTERPTGCTVVVFDSGAVAGVDVRGSAPGTRETDLLNPINTVQHVNAILLTGGSAFGLDAATGVMRYLEEHGLGFAIGSLVVPIVPAAVLFDLSVGNGHIRPNADSGYRACAAASAAPVPLGNVGAGAGATVGKLFGMQSAMKTGIGSASLQIGQSDLTVGALVALNAVGDIFDPRTGALIAGARTPDGKAFRHTLQQWAAGATINGQPGANSTIAVVATNATLTKTEATKMAQMAHDGLARSINPVHTAYDGDTVFAAATGKSKTTIDVAAVGALAAECLTRAVQSAVFSATGLPGLPAARDLT